MLPKDRADATARWLLDYLRIENRCRKAVYEQHRLGLVALDSAWRQSAAAVDEARVQGRVEAGAQWAAWEVALLSGGVALGAVAVGLLVGLVAGGVDTVVVK